MTMDDGSRSCEHCDEPAPPFKRFCSYGCQTCEQWAFGRDSGCDGMCERLNEAERAAAQRERAALAAAEGEK